MDLPQTCEDVEAALPLFVGSDLEPAEMDAVRLHLEGCEDCGALARRAVAARGVLVGARYASPLAGPSLWEGIRPELVAEGLIASSSSADASTGDAPPVRSARPRLTSFQRFGIGSAAAAAAVLFAFTLAGQLRPEAPAGPSSPVSSGERAATVAVSVPTPVGPVEDTRVVFPNRITPDGWQPLRAAQDGDQHMLDVAGDFRVPATSPPGGMPGTGTELVRGR